MSRAGPRVLLLSMYPLDRGLWGATTRITQLRDELRRLVRLDVISGTRAPRAAAIARYVAGGRLRDLAGIYVETSTTLPGPADLGLLALARARRIRVLTYVRDAQQLFPEYAGPNTLRRRIARTAFLPALRALMAASSQVAFPSRGLAAAIVGERAANEALLLPPGARLADPLPPIDPAARGLLFVGSLRHAAHGGDLLFEAHAEAARRGQPAELIWVAPADEPMPAAVPPGVRVERATGSDIDRLLPGVRASITPRRRTPYNDLAVPIKVLEYLGYGRPLLVTDTHETAAIVRDAGCGIIVPDSTDGLARGIVELMSAPFEQITAWGAAARAAAERNTWASRAGRVLELLGIGERRSMAR
jgi:glycosyltransferase involved in cell wall biosynthesis